MNIAGQSQPSCVNKTLPYIPSTNDIEYSLVRVGDSYSLNITTQVCYMEYYTLVVNFIYSINI